MDDNFEERRVNPVKLSEEQIEEIAVRVEKLMRENFYASVGKNVIERFFWFIGFLAVGVYAFLKSKGLVE